MKILVLIESINNKIHPVSIEALVAPKTLLAKTLLKYIPYP